MGLAGNTWDFILGEEVIILQIVDKMEWTILFVRSIGNQPSSDHCQKCFSSLCSTETCPCPDVLYANWAELPPYVTKPAENDQQPQGILGSIVEDMLLTSCGICTKGHGQTALSYEDNGKGNAAHKRTMNAVREDVDHRTQVSFPVIGAMDDDKFQKEYVFVPVVESPGIVFITVSQNGSKASALSAIVQYLPLYMFCLIMAYAAGVIIWALVSYLLFGFTFFIKPISNCVQHFFV